MLKHLFGTRATTRADVVIGFGAAILAAYKAFDTAKQYNTEKDPNRKAARELIERYDVNQEKNS